MIIAIDKAAPRVAIIVQLESEREVVGLQANARQVGHGDKNFRVVGAENSPPLGQSFFVELARSVKLPLLDVYAG